MPGERVAYAFPYDSNIRYLPLVYIIPYEMIFQYPTLCKISRCMGDLAEKPEETNAIINSDQFLNEIMDAVSALAFPHFGFGGWKEHYTGYCPVWQLSYVLPLWAKLLEEETGWGLYRILHIPSTDIIPFFDPVFIRDVMERVVKRAIAEQNWQPILDVVKEMPCDEDFESWNTNVRIDFIRKWYHTRSKKVRSVSLEECLEDGEDHGELKLFDVSAETFAKDEKSSIIFPSYSAKRS